MGVIGDKLAQAMKEKQEAKQRAKNDMTTWVWKGPKKEFAGMRCQSTFKLIDATPEQLENCFKHCKSMLFNTSKQNPGRYKLKEIVEDQINKCSTELFIRWAENKYQMSDRDALPRTLLYKDLSSLLSDPANKAQFSREDWNKIPIKSCVPNSPDEFRDVNAKQVLDGCLDLLGTFSRKHITLTFLLKLGVNLSPSDIRTLKQPNVKITETVKTKLGIPVVMKLSRNFKGLTYKELESIIHLREAKYSELDNDKLVLLRDKVLPRFSDEIDFQIYQWETIISHINTVSVSKYNKQLLPDEGLI